MIILKPDNGFVIPVEYIANEKLYDTNNKNLRYEIPKKIVDFANNNSIYHENKAMKINLEDNIVHDRLIDEEDDNYSEELNENTIATILEEEKKQESRSGILIFDDNTEDNNIELDEISSMRLDRARGNLRKAIEVEIEKVGKLVLDDNEININSSASVKETDVKMNEHNADELEGNIVVDDTREEVKDGLVGEVTLSNGIESEASEEASENDKLS